MKEYLIDEYFEFTFNTQAPTTGVATDADATPTYRVYEENNDTVIDSGDCTKRDDGNTTGYYYVRGQCTTALGYEAGKTYEVRCAATVGGVAGAEVVGRFLMVTVDADTQLAAISGIGTAGGAAINTDAYADNFHAGTGSAADGVLVSGTLTPTVSPAWTVGQLDGKRIKLDATWYTITSNTATACVVASPPADATYTYIVDVLGGGVTQNTYKIGSEGATSNANTSNVNGVFHTVTHSGNAIDVVYEFRCGGGTSPVSAKWTGYLTSGNDTVTVSAWNHVGAAWEQVQSIVGQSGTANVVKDATLYARHMGTSAAELGKVYLRLHCTGMSSPVLNTDQLYVSYAVTSRTVGYAQGLIWIDTVNGSPGSELFVNGTADNPVDNYADAELLETALGTARFHVSNGSSLTVSGAVNDFDQHAFHGDNWTLVCTNSLDITGAYIEGATISGSTTGDGAVLSKCVIGDLTIAEADFKECHLLGNITLVASKDYNFVDCVDDDAATTTQPKLTFAATNNVGMRRYSGGLELASMVATDYLTCDGSGRLVIGSTCSANPNGNITLRGAWATSTDNVSGGFKGTITQTQRLSSADVTADSVWDEVITTGHAVSNSAAAVINALVAKFAGITLVAKWLSAFARKDAADATALSEINTGGGGYSETTDSLEGIADKTSALTAQETRDALKLAPSPGAGATGSIDALLALQALEATLTAIKGATWTTQTLEAIYAAITTAAGSGSIICDHTVELDDDPIEDAHVAYYTDSSRTDLAASGTTNSFGVVTFNLTAGTYYTRTLIAGQPVTDETVVVS